MLCALQSLAQALVLIMLQQGFQACLCPFKNGRIPAGSVLVGVAVTMITPDAEHMVMEVGAYCMGTPGKYCHRQMVGKSSVCSFPKQDLEKVTVVEIIPNKKDLTDKPCQS